MSFVALNPANAFATPKDEAAIKTIVESVGTLADTSNFETLESLYAPEVEMDYTSLSGGEVETKSPQAIMSQWLGYCRDLIEPDIRCPISKSAKMAKRQPPLQILLQTTG